MASDMAGYVIITPAHNEEAFIAKTAESVIAQSVRPLKWIVVNDASTDKTAEIIVRYSAQHSFIELVNLERRPGRHFGNKVSAFNRGLVKVKEVGYDYIGNLDADISLEYDYYESVLREFHKDQKLGIAGGIVYTKVGDNFITYDKTLDSIGGAVQLFRRGCFQEIGGYISLPYGGIDAAAEITARMKGWRVRKFTSLKVLEHRRTGSAQSGPLRAKVREGQRMYSLGYGWLFYILRCVFRVRDQPFIIGSIALLFGYMDSLLRRRPVVLSEEVVAYLKAEQNQRLKKLPATLLGLERSSGEMDPII